MFDWLKTKIFQLGDFFSNAWNKVRNFFVGESQRPVDYQPIPADLSQPDHNEESSLPNSSQPQRKSDISPEQNRSSDKPSAKRKVKNDSDNIESSYEQLPNELQVGIFDYLKDNQAAQSALIKTSSRFYNLFQPKRLVDQLIQYIVYGNQQKAEVIIKANPALLTMEGEAVDYSGRIIKGTALQAALGTEDVKYHDDEECMVEMIQKHLKELPSGNEIMQQQIAEQFPEGWEQVEAERVQRDSVALNTVIDAIRNSQDGDNCEAAIQEFRDYLDRANKGKVFSTGKHFNHQLLDDALRLYSENHEEFGGKLGRQNLICWQKVIGYIQRYVPAATAQAFCTGIDRITSGDSKLIRSLWFYCRGKGYYPLDSDSTYRLGYDCAAWWHLIPFGSKSGSRRSMRKHDPAPLTKFLSKKTENLNSLCATTCVKRLGA